MEEVSGVENFHAKDIRSRLRNSVVHQESGVWIEQ